MSTVSEFDYYILFPNHHEGLRLLKAMRDADVDCAVSPTPRAASRCCGISLRVAPTGLEAARKIIADTGVEVSDIVRLPRSSGTWNRTC